MKLSPLRQHIIQLRGVSFKPNDVVSQLQDGYVPIVKSNNIKEDGFDSSNLIYIKRSMVRPEQFIQAGDVVMTASSGSKKTIGKNIQFQHDYIGSFGAFCKLIRPKKSINSKYLYHFLRTSFFRNTIETLVQGANIANLKNEYIDQLQIALPSLNDQIRIAHLLCKVEGLIAQRKQHLKQLDDLLKSVFLEMFGDPVRNEKGWDTDLLESMVAHDCPLTYGIVQPGDEFSGGIPIVRPVDLSGDFVSMKGLKKIDPKIDAAFQRTKLKGGELLMCVRGTTGVISIALSELNGANVTRGITPIWFTKEINTNFVLHQLKSHAIQRKIKEKTYGVALQQINLRDVRLIKMIVPPINIQSRFSDFSEKISELKANYQKCLADLEALYGALSQQAFKGELDLSRIKLHENRDNARPTKEDNSLELSAFLRKSDKPATPQQIVNFLAQTKLPDERSALIAEWFEHYLADSSPDSHLGSAQFLESTWQVLQDERFEIDGETPAITMDDYDMLKDLVFEALNTGRLIQSQNQDHCLIATKEIVYGNCIELKSGAQS